METIVGIFTSMAEAERAVDHLRRIGIPGGNLNILTPGHATLEQLSTTETESPGMGQAIGAVVGGATGAFAGLSIAATLLLPGVGVVTAVGLAAAGLLAAAGAVGGATAGSALEDALDHGLPVDEVYVYEDALQRGRTVVVVEVGEGAHSDLVRSVLVEDGAESVDAAREQWWVGLRDAEEAEYRAGGGNFETDEAEFRRGFEVAQLPGVRGRTYEQALDYLRARYPDVYDDRAFRRGFERGQFHREQARVYEEGHGVQ